MRFFATILAVGCLVLPAAAFASDVDLDNNRIPGDESWTITPYDGPLSLGSTLVAFPVSSDNFSVLYFPYWWNVGDTGWGLRVLGEPTVTSAMLVIYLDLNVLGLGCDTDEFDFLLNGIVVGHFSLSAADGLGPIIRNIGPFPPVAAMPGNMYELRYRVTETVISGCGSVAFNLSGACSVELAGPPVSVESASWGSVKALYQ